MSKLYQAINGNGTPVITVIADDPEAARAEVERQLNRPGRKGFLDHWKQGGSKLRDKETGTVV